MKKNKNKTNLLIILSLLTLIIYFLYSLGCFLNTHYREREFLFNSYNTCISESKDKSSCVKIKKELDGLKIPPAPLLYSYILASGITNMEYLTVTMILFVAVPSIYEFYCDTKSGVYKVKLTRKQYRNFILDHYKNSLKAILILPAFFLITFFITCLVAKFKFQYSPGELEYGAVTFWSSQEYARSLWIPYYLTMFFAIITHSIYYINITYMMFFKVKNFFVNIIATYLNYLITQTVLLSIVATLLGKLFKAGEFFITLFDLEIWQFGSDVSHFEYMIISSTLYVIVSTLFVYILYHSEERYVIANEE